MIIEDDELRDLYKTSSQEHLQKLEAELMRLEKNPDDSEAIKEFLREAHTLKGDSRMLGLDDIEMLVHHIEDCVEKVQEGERAITEELCDRLYRGLDAINGLAHEAITGEISNINASEVLSFLMGSESVIGHEDDSSGEPFAGDEEEDLFGDEEEDLFGDEEEDLFGDQEEDLFGDQEEDLFGDQEEDLFGDEEEELFPAENVVKAAPKKPVTKTIPAASTKPLVKPAAPSREYQIDTIRVEPQKLDTLMTQVSELTVTKLRISRQMEEIKQLTALWEEWNKNNTKYLPILKNLEHNLNSEQFEPLKYFFDRTQQRLENLGTPIESLKTRASEDIARLDIITDRLESGIQGLRQLPLSTVFNLFPRMVRDIARQQGKKIEFLIEGGDTKADKKILEEIKDPLLHLLRNAIDHGIETPEERERQGKIPTATIVLRGYQSGNSIGIEILDDGKGLNLNSIQNTAIKRGLHTEAELASMSTKEIQALIFASGFSTRTEVTELSGRGVGLDVVRANVERLKGSIEVYSTPNEGCHFKIRLNTTLATTQVLIVDIGETLYALPVEFVQTMMTISTDQIITIEDSQTIPFEDRPISITWLADLLQIPVAPESKTNDSFYCVVLRISGEYLAVIVDRLVDKQDVVLKPQSKLLRRIPNVTGATILGDGEVCMILNPPDLLHSVRQGSWHEVSQHDNKSTRVKNKLLLVEDSIIIRTQMIRLLKDAGYEVTATVDGLEGYNTLRTGDYDIVVSDVEMPNMTGLELAAKIRQHSEYNDLPMVLITTLASPEDRERGKQAGANAYLTKGDFDRQLLIDTLKNLLY